MSKYTVDETRKPLHSMMSSFWDCAKNIYIFDNPLQDCLPNDY